MEKTFQSSVSFLMLSYNHVDFIERSLKSIFNQKSYITDIEIIIIDDGSTDGTKQKIEEIICLSDSDILIRTYFKKHSGIASISKNFQELINLSTKEYVCFIASDDIFVPNAFYEQINIMHSKNIMGVYANGTNLYYDGKKESCMNKTDIDMLQSESVDIVYDYMIKNVPSVFIQSCIVKSSFIKSYDAFDTDLIADDWVFNIKFFERLKETGGSFKFINKVVFIRNIHKENTSRNPVSQYVRIKQVSDKYCPETDIVKSSAFWISLYLLIKNMEFNSLYSLLKHHFISFSILKPTCKSFLKVLMIKTFNRKL